MSKYKELVYFVLDAIKAVSDDSFITEDHVIFLLNKYRSYLLKQKYDKDPRKQVPDSNYQTLELNMRQYGKTDVRWDETCDGGEDTTKATDKHIDVYDLDHYMPGGFDGNIVKRTYLKSLEEIPFTMQLGITSCYIVDPFQAIITMVSKERLEFVCWNKFLQKIIYGAIGPDNKLYIKSNNFLFLSIKKVHVRGIFEDPTALMDDAMEEDFPMEESLIPLLLKSVIADLLGFEYRPQDPANNANDDLSDIANFIRQNMKDRYSKEHLDDTNV